MPLGAKVATLIRSLSSTDNRLATFGAYGLRRVGVPVEELTVRLRDGTSVQSPAHYTGSGPVFEVLAADSYHLGELSRYMAAPEAIVDIGAHVGSAAVAMHRFFPDSQFFCYEPSASSRDYLRRNLATNHVKAEVVEAAVGARSGFVTLLETSRASCGASVRPLSLADDPASRVPVVGFDDLVSAIPLPVGIVKMDCEGSEYEIVETSKVTSWDNVRCVLLEYHAVAGHTYVDIINKFAGMGFVETRHVRIGDSTQGRGEVCLFRPAQAVRDEDRGASTAITP